MVAPKVVDYKIVPFIKNNEAISCAVSAVDYLQIIIHLGILNVFYILLEMLNIQMAV